MAAQAIISVSESHFIVLSLALNTVLVQFYSKEEVFAKERNSHSPKVNSTVFITCLFKKKSVSINTSVKWTIWKDESVKTFYFQSQPEQLGLSGKLIYECLQLNKQKTDHTFGDCHYNFTTTYIYIILQCASMQNTGRSITKNVLKKSHHV